METSAKTAMNVNDIFMAIGMLDVFCIVCLWRILINARVIRLPYLTESSALQKWLCYDEPYKIGVHLKTHSVVVKTRSVCFAYTFTVFIVYQWRDRELFQFEMCLHSHCWDSIVCSSETKDMWENLLIYSRGRTSLVVRRLLSFVTVGDVFVGFMNIYRNAHVLFVSSRSTVTSCRVETVIPPTRAK